MKTPSAMRTVLNLLVAFCTIVALPASAQHDGGDFFTVSGIVRDSSSGRTLPGAGVSVPGTRVGTVANSDGSFSIKVRRDLGARELEFSHLGYDLLRLPLAGRDAVGITVRMSTGEIVLPDVTVVGGDARETVYAAIERFGANYSDRTNLLTGFYRETVRKRSQYVDIAEAVVEVFRDPYSNIVRGDRLRIVKGRRLVSPRTTDTLAVKLQGGPNGYLQGDIVSNRDFLLAADMLDYYRFTFEGFTVIDDRSHHTVRFEPQVVFPEHALYTGRLYIDRETLAISRAEFSLDVSDRDKVTALILRRKPANLRFNPLEVSYVLSYRNRDGRSYLHYSGCTIRFRCDWRRRLFTTSYTVSSETVITDGRDEAVGQIPLRESFRSSQSLVDRVADFYGPEFWDDYNIIAPTESLESAVDRLKRRIE